ncbi:MAG: redoxin domain-containing protein [Gemmatimonadales bacterium]
MTRFKRYFPIPYLLAATLALGHVVFHLLKSSEVGLAWVGALVAVSPLVAFMASLVLLKRARGGPLLELVLRDADGNAVPVSNERHALFMFVRGNWCPLCMAQVREIAAQYRELEARGVDLYVITPQPDNHTRALARRFDVPIRFCVDEGGGLARRLGIQHPGGVPFLIRGYGVDSVLPTVLITDPQRKIIFVDMTDNYRVRPEPATFLAVLDARA